MQEDKNLIYDPPVPRDQSVPALDAVKTKPRLDPCVMGGLVSPNGASYHRSQRVTLGLRTGQVYLLVIHPHGRLCKQYLKTKTLKFMFL